jgi:hypothetical protein
MFEDDDYSRRVRLAGFRIVCAEDVFVHHFGQAALGELRSTGEYGRVFETNRRRFEEKWNVRWEPHHHRVTSEYEQLRRRIRDAADTTLPPDATVMVISKGDNQLLELNGRRTRHFSQADNGGYEDAHPADSREAIALLESGRSTGAGFLLIPKTSFWWLEYYRDFREHLEHAYTVAMRDERTCLIYDLEDRV